MVRNRHVISYASGASRRKSWINEGNQGRQLASRFKSGFYHLRHGSERRLGPSQSQKLLFLPPYTNYRRHVGAHIPNIGQQFEIKTCVCLDQHNAFLGSMLHDRIDQR